MRAILPFIFMLRGFTMKKEKIFRFAARMGVYCLGLMFLALGVAVSVNSNLGVSPVNSLPYIVSLIIRVPMGTCVTTIFCFYILLQFLLLGKQFNPINVLQIAFATIFGYFVDSAKALIGAWALPGYLGQLAMLAMSIVLIALGILLYMEAQLVPMPMEGLTATIARKMNVPFPKMKTVVDCIVVGVGLVLSFSFLGRLDGIREGTIITAAVVGRLIGLLKKPISPVVSKICFGKR